MYDGTSYVELEDQGPYSAVAASATVHWAMRWHVEALAGHRTVNDAVLISAVNQLVQ